MSASITQKKPCSKCEKGNSIFTCDGCQRSFCRKHSDEHRKELSAQMEIVGQHHDMILRDINQDTSNHEVLNQIDVWEQESINTIKQVAEQVRMDVKHFFHQTKHGIKTKLTKLANELQCSTVAEDYTEIDLKNWMDKLNEFRMEVEQAMNVHVLDDDNKKSIIRFIRTSNRQQSNHSPRSTTTNDPPGRISRHVTSVDQEMFGAGDSEVSLSEDNLLATYRGPKLNRSGIRFCTNHYWQGKHLIRFRIETKTSDNFYLGIVTASQTDPAYVFAGGTTVNGWWRCQYAVVFGEIQEPSTVISIKEGDEISLLLDCDDKVIHLQHYGTKRRLSLFIDTDRCPLPWKVVVGLATVGNVIRILQ